MAGVRVSEGDFPRLARKDKVAGQLAFTNAEIGRFIVTRAIEPRYRQPGQRGILDEGLRGGGSE